MGPCTISDRFDFSQLQKQHSMWQSIGIPRSLKLPGRFLQDAERSDAKSLPAYGERPQELPRWVLKLGLFSPSLQTQQLLVPDSCRMQAGLKSQFPDSQGSIHTDPGRAAVTPSPSASSSFPSWSPFSEAPHSPPAQFCDISVIFTEMYSRDFCATVSPQAAAPGTIAFC